MCERTTLVYTIAYICARAVKRVCIQLGNMSLVFINIVYYMLFNKTSLFNTSQSARQRAVTNDVYDIDITCDTFKHSLDIASKGKFVNQTKEVNM